jgi:hypothetical protein
MLKPPSLVIVSLCLSLFPGLALADDMGSNSTSCAERDVRATVMIERHGAAQDVTARGLYGAAVAQQLARSACREGRTDEGTALYDLIHTLGPVRTLEMARD